MNPAWAERFSAVERRSPTLAALHLAAACFWCFCISIGHAPEGITYGPMLAFALLRLPHTYRLYALLLRSAPFIAFACWVFWNLASYAWSPVPIEKLSLLISRPMLACLALWPLAARWSALLIALAAGSTASAVFTVLTSLGTDGIRRRELASRLVSHLTSASLVASLGACVFLALAVHTRAVRAWLGAMLASGLCCLQLVILAGRGATLALVAGYVSILVRRVSSVRPGARAATALAVAAIAIGAAIMDRNYLTQRFSWVIQEAQSLRNSDGQFLLPRANERILLWRVAWHKGWDHPIIGNGINSWKTVAADALEDEPLKYANTVEEAQQLAAVPNPHCMYINAWFATGIIGVAIFFTLIVTVLCRLWRAAAGGWTGRATLGIAVVWCVTGFFGAADQIAVGGFVLAFCVMAAALQPRNA